jgi:hypothetical protein
MYSTCVVLFVLLLHCCRKKKSKKEQDEVKDEIIAKTSQLQSDALASVAHKAVRAASTPGSAAKKRAREEGYVLHLYIDV